jgi:hypothetical protein
MNRVELRKLAHDAGFETKHMHPVSEDAFFDKLGRVVDAVERRCAEKAADELKTSEERSDA